jgi:hypothetical protein
LREEKWQRLRDAAMKNKDSSTPLPASLLESVAPLGTYDPMREYDAVDDLSGGEMEEDGQTLSMSMAEHSSDEPERGVDLLPMESDDGHGELVSPISCTSLVPPADDDSSTAQPVPRDCTTPSTRSRSESAASRPSKVGHPS